MDPLKPVIDALHSEGRLRVWSLVITVFGDSVLPRGGHVPTARLRALMTRIGVEDGALRTALSRLANDGWVVSERKGRASIYHLSPEGVKKFAPATRSIYSPVESDETGEWVVSLGETRKGAVQIAPGVWLGKQAANIDAELALKGKLITVSDDFADTLVESSHLSAAEALRQDLITLGKADLDPLSAAAARTLLVHRWRRIVLRFAEYPAALLPRSHPLNGLRADVARVYDALSSVADSWWQSDVDGLVALPKSDSMARNRFAVATKA